MSKFQILFIAFFSFAAILGVFLFATFRGGSGEQPIQVVIWGTMPQEDFISWYSQTPTSQKPNIKVSYVAKHPDNFDIDFVEALADGRGPDIVFLPHDKILEHQNRIYKIPYSTLSERDFRDTFIEGTEIYLDTDGMYGIPITVDPLVMFWNRDIFRNASLSTVPLYWDELPDLSLLLTQRDPAGNITQSTISFGEYGNVFRARDALSALFLQAGTPITQKTHLGVRAAFSGNYGFATAPADAVLTFYTQFANPGKDIYTWNRSFPSSLTAFASGDVALMVGRSSDLFRIQDRNPNLNFDVALLPQPREATVRMTYGAMEALALVRQSRDIPGSYRVIQELTSTESIKILANTLKLPPVRRDVLVERPTDAYQSLFYDSALISRAWLSPHPEDIDNIFATMIEAITSGRLRMGEVIQNTQTSLDRALGN